MPVDCPGLPDPATPLEQRIRSLLRRGLPPAELRRRLHLLFPDEPPRSFDALLRQHDLLQEPLPHPIPLQNPTDRHIRLGVEIVAALAAGLQPRPESALSLDSWVYTALDELTEQYDPSGQAMSHTLGLIAALRDRMTAGTAPEVSESAYREVLQDIVLMVDLPPGLELGWPASPEVVAKRLGGGDWGRALAAIGLIAAPGSARPRTAVEDVLQLDDPGIGLVAVPEPQDDEPEHVWDELHDRLAADLAAVPWHGVLVVRYDPPPDRLRPPVAWARTGPDGARICLSGFGGTSTSWPWEDSYFEEGRWRAPADQATAWNAGPLGFHAAAELMVEGLRFGRACNNPYRYRWGVDDGVPEPEASEHAKAPVIALAPSAPPAP